MCTCGDAHTCVCMCMYVWGMQACMCVFMGMCAHTGLHTRACVFMCVPTCACVLMHIGVLPCTSVCTLRGMCVHVYMHVC